jgi:branched-chain amino acid transport system permease protein
VGRILGSFRMLKIQPSQVVKSRLVPVILLLLPLLFVPSELTQIDLAWDAAPRGTSLATSAAIFAIAAYGLTLLMRFGGMLSVVHGALFGVGAYTVGIIVRDLGWDFWAVYPLAAVVPAALALLFGPIALRTHGVAFIVITLALGEFLVLIGNNGGDFTGGLDGLIARGFPGDVGPLSFRSTVERYYIVVAILYGVIGIFWFISRTQFARRLEAIRDNPDLASSLGINAYIYRLLLFTLSAALAGLAGPLFLNHLRVVDPTAFGTFAFVNILLMVVMGGLGVLAGPALGAWLVIFIPEWLGPAGLGDPGVQRIVFGVLLLVFMLVAPQGVAGTIKVLFARWSQALAQQGSAREVLQRWRSGGAMPAPSPSIAPPPPTSALNADDPPAAPHAPPREPLKTTSRPFMAKAPRESTETVLEVRNLVKTFDAVQALDGVDLTVSEGQLLGIIGPNGSGKTTLFNCISGFLSPTDGNVIWRGRDVTGWPPDRISRHGLVRTFQDAMLFRTFTVRGSCEVALEALNAIGKRFPGDPDIPNDTDGILAFCQLSDEADLPVSDLPHGTARRLGLALTLLTSPKLLMLDEPAAGLNDIESAAMGQLLSRVRDAGVTLIVIDHDMPFLMPLAEHIVVLDAGRVLTQGSPEEIQRNPAVIAAYLGEQFAASALAADP